MTGKPLVSILTPIYNQHPYIAQTINSVLNQTYQNWEWIIIDDGSNDGTGDIINKIKDSRIRYTYQEHAGFYSLAKTFNKALKMSNGNLIAMLDGDDYWPDYKLEVQVKSFNDSDIVLSYGEYFLVNQNCKKIKYVNIPKDPFIASNNPVGSALKKFILEMSCFLLNSTVMLKKSILLNIGGFVEGEGFIQDFPTWIKLSLEGKFSAVPVCLGYYRKHPSSLTMRENSERLFDYSINFLSKFIIQNVEKLHEFGFFFDLERLEEHWRKMKTYLPFNNAMYLLMIESFEEAEAEFKKFLENYPSIKHKLIYYLIILSALLKFDLVTPIAILKDKIRKAL
jgi:glycosyltransferase involved in cell wall biosynthesis